MAPFYIFYINYITSEGIYNTDASRTLISIFIRTLFQGPQCRAVGSSMELDLLKSFSPSMSLGLTVPSNIIIKNEKKWLNKINIAHNNSKFYIQTIGETIYLFLKKKSYLKYFFK